MTATTHRGLTWDDRHWRLVVVALRVAGALTVGGYLLIVGILDRSPWDAHAYFVAATNPDAATHIIGMADAYIYPPAFAQALTPLASLGWPVFAIVFRATIGVAFIYMAGPFALPLLLWPPVTIELNAANIHLLLALVCVAGLRYPAVWSFALLTKVTPGVCLLWFVARREWRHLAIALGVTALIAVVSFALAPGGWLTWIGDMVANAADGGGANASPYRIAGMPPLAMRLPLTAVIVWIGARRNWPEVLPVAMLLALPVMWDISAVILVAMIPSLTARWLGRRPALAVMAG